MSADSPPLCFEVFVGMFVVLVLCVVVCCFDQRGNGRLKQTDSSDWSDAPDMLARKNRTFGATKIDQWGLP
jgi:hypothetical protein